MASKRAFRGPGASLSPIVRILLVEATAEEVWLMPRLLSRGREVLCRTLVPSKYNLLSHQDFLLIHSTETLVTCGSFFSLPIRSRSREEGSYFGMTASILKLHSSHETRFGVADLHNIVLKGVDSLPGITIDDILKTKASFNRFFGKAQLTMYSLSFFYPRLTGFDPVHWIFFLQIPDAEWVSFGWHMFERIIYIISIVNLRSQKRLAASVAKVGERKIWLDPAEQAEIGNANSRTHVKKLIKDGRIIIKPTTVHSRARTRDLLAAKRKGRHTGPGKRKGTSEARMPTKVMWMRRQRVLRRLLRKYRVAGKIDKHLYVLISHTLFKSCCLNFLVSCGMKVPRPLPKIQG